jgi:hypothetical protein
MCRLWWLAIVVTLVTGVSVCSGAASTQAGKVSGKLEVDEDSSGPIILGSATADTRVAAQAGNATVKTPQFLNPGPSVSVATIDKSNLGVGSYFGFFNGVGSAGAGVAADLSAFGRKAAVPGLGYLGVPMFPLPAESGNKRSSNLVLTDSGTDPGHALTRAGATAGWTSTEESFGLGLYARSWDARVSALVNKDPTAEGQQPALEGIAIATSTDPWYFTTPSNLSETLSLNVTLSDLSLTLDPDFQGAANLQGYFELDQVSGDGKLTPLVQPVPLNLTITSGSLSIPSITLVDLESFPLQPDTTYLITAGLTGAVESASVPEPASQVQATLSALIGLFAYRRWTRRKGAVRGEGTPEAWSSSAFAEREPTKQDYPTTTERPGKLTTVWPPPELTNPPGKVIAELPGIEITIPPGNWTVVWPLGVVTTNPLGNFTRVPW